VHKQLSFLDEAKIEQRIKMNGIVPASGGPLKCDFGASISGGAKQNRIC
jgi:hypothetical protein